MNTKLSVSLPSDMVAFVKRVAKDQRIKASQVIANVLRPHVDKDRRTR
jgi:metal-responsive CopG/Arc/MetJ family transcriptional regulator